ncbi:MAG: nucleotide exchange factor GrpE [Candidatus Krumholzibacteria bacterium]|nr:nucleotide exchange factor GrpE [Candidatus Krumholzibacteria bacterium]
MSSEGKKTGDAGSARKVEVKDTVDPDDIEILHDDVDEEEGSEQEAETPEIAGTEDPEWLTNPDSETEQKPEKKPKVKDTARKKSKKASEADIAEHLARKNEMLQKLRDRLVETEKIVVLKEDRLMRLAAEFENYKKRTSREWDLLKNQANAGLLAEILGVLDDLDRAFEHSGDSFEHFKGGIVLIHSSLLDLLKRNGLSEIESAGKPFDPQYHEAVAEMHSENIESGFVAEVVLKGYLLNDQVIRPAKVVVSKGSK